MKPPRAVTLAGWALLIAGAAVLATIVGTLLRDVSPLLAYAYAAVLAILAGMAILGQEGPR